MRQRSHRRSLRVALVGALLLGLVPLGTALQGFSIAAGTVVEPLRDARDGRRAGTGLAGDLAVMPALVKQLHHMPSLRQVMQLADGAEVAEEAPRGGHVGERKDGLENQPPYDREKVHFCQPRTCPATDPAAPPADSGPAPTPEPAPKS